MIRMDRNKGAVGQGDCLIVPVESLPEGIGEPVDPNGEGFIVVAHSETGHHHTLPSRSVRAFAASAMLLYLRVLEEAELKHHRSKDTHETIVLPPGDYKLYRQREGSPEGWRRVED